MCYHFAAFFVITFFTCFLSSFLARRVRRRLSPLCVVFLNVAWEFLVFSYVSSAGFVHNEVLPFPVPCHSVSLALGSPFFLSTFSSLQPKPTKFSRLRHKRLKLVGCAFGLFLPPFAKVR
jgi:hypothetical protein